MSIHSCWIWTKAPLMLVPLQRRGLTWAEKQKNVEKMPMLLKKTGTMEKYSVNDNYVFLKKHGTSDKSLKLLQTRNLFQAIVG